MGTIGASGEMWCSQQLFLEVSCGSGFYVRSLARDVAHDLASEATVTELIRVKQGPFLLEHALPVSRRGG